MRLSLSFLLFFLFISGCDKSDSKKTSTTSLQVTSALVGTFALNATDFTKNINAPYDKPIVISFSSALDIKSVTSLSIILKQGSNNVDLDFSFIDNNKTVSALPKQNLSPGQKYTLTVANSIKGASDEQFAGTTIDFTTVILPLQIVSLKIGSQTVPVSGNVKDVPLSNLTIEVNFSAPVDPMTINAANVQIIGPGNPSSTFLLQDSDKKLIITVNQTLKHFNRHRLYLAGELKGKAGESFPVYIREFYTAIDPNPKFPVISDDALLTLVQQQTFKYFWDFGHPNSGLARERDNSGDIVTTGGSGFGIMSIVVGIERGFITRSDGVLRLKKIVSFLENANRFHGAWPHWINGNTGIVIPFSTKDNGGDLVETSFLVQGLLTFRQYLQPADTVGNNLIRRITKLYDGVEWDWYRKNNSNVLYWHWSPNYAWDMNFPLYGYFEEQVTYFLAAASTTHPIPKICYTNGFAKNGSIVKNNSYYGYTLQLESPSPLFWVHYSYVGMDPHFTDDYVNYWTQNVNASKINHAYCVANPRGWVGYSDENWGLTASDNQNGYSAHSPGNDLGVISPTAALSSFPYTPVESMKALKFFYYTNGDKLWGQYGFYDAYNTTAGWYATSYLAIDQGPIIVMIENYRTGLLWNLFMSSPEVAQGRTVLNFN
ncbi:hypothetical protein BH09BAC3_BH09BAC3_10830 [soil metagenome]